MNRSELEQLFELVEQRWPQSRYDLRILRELEDDPQSPPWFIEVNDPVESVEGIAVGDGRTLIEALRWLLFRTKEPT